MCKIKPLIIIYTLFFSVHYPVTSQEIPEFKFGKISKEDVENNICDIDSSANAFFLFDEGTSYIIYTTSIGFQIRHNRHCAIKILTKSGYEYASFKIPVYESSSGRMEENVSGIKAVTYNLENGKVNKSSISKSDIFTENENENWKNVSFSLPNVVEGSVIEVGYSIVSDFLWNLPTWSFQYDIPSKWSILRTEIPEYYSYSRQMKGYVPLFFHDHSSRMEQITFTSVNRLSSNGLASGRSEYQHTRVSYRLDEEVFVAKDVPAFKSEAYIDAEQNYMSSISFELQSIKFPDSPISTYTTTWEEICKKLMTDENFGQQLKAVSAAKDIVEGLKVNELPEKEKSVKIFEYVKHSVKWDERYAATCANVKQVIKEGVGNSGDINMMLINLLNAAGVEVYPVLLRTRYAGKLPVFHPSLSSLNYLIAAVKAGDEIYLLDATEKEIPFGVVPERCINDKGLLLYDKGSFDWVDLNAKNYSKYTLFGEIEMQKEGDLNVLMNNRHEGYFALDRRQELKPGKEENIEDFEKEHNGFIVENYEIVNRDQYNTYLTEKIEGTISDKVSVAGDMMYFNPCLYEKIDENPFKVDERKYPVDFAYPLNNNIVFTFVIPENWAVESLPENLNVSLLENRGKFMYNIKQMNNKIIFTQSLTITSTIFLPEQYKALKEFFRMLVDKENEQIVLKKI